jgi:putative ABC transport system permease protein
LRALGYRRRSILASFLIEGEFLAFIGGLLGCVISFILYAIFRSHPLGTMSFETFSEIVFQFRITPQLAFKGLAFSVLVGLIGSLLPAIRAARLPVISALKSV